MEYQVPQFIEVEDKIFGPPTLKQFIFVAGGVGICAVLILYLHFFGIILSIPFAALALALAFYKVNNKSFTDIVEAAFNYYFGGRLYLWKKDTAGQNAPQVQTPAPQVQEARQKLELTRGKLHELAWSLDIKDAQNGQDTQNT